MTSWRGSQSGVEHSYACIYINVHYNLYYASPIISYFLLCNLILYCVLHTVYCILYIVFYIMHMRGTSYFANW